MRKIISVIIFISILGIIVFIWFNSMKSMEQSASISDRFTVFLTPVLEKFVGSGNVTDHLIRKMAHYFEFAALGGLAMLFAVVHSKMSLQSLSNCLFAVLAVAVADESIQLIFNRGSQVQDILLDFFGGCSGMILIIIPTLIVYIVLLISRQIKLKNRRRRSHRA